MSDAAIRLVLVDDHPIVLHGLQQLFERHERFHVLSCCRNGRDALDFLRGTSVDVVVLDVRMPDGSGLDVLETITRERFGCRVVLLTAALRDADAFQALKRGAQGLVLKESSPEELLDCVQRVHAGEQWIDRGMTIGMPPVATSSDEPQAVSTLTPRELEIVRMVGLGLRNRDIAQRLTISEGTVKIHLHNVYEKVGVDGRLELLLHAQERGLL